MGGRHGCGWGPRLGGATAVAALAVRQRIETLASYIGTLQRSDEETSATP